MIGFTKLEHLNTNGEENFIKISYFSENNASIVEINCNGQKHSFPTAKNDGFEKIQLIKMDAAWPIRQLALTEWSNVTSSEKFLETQLIPFDITIYSFYFGNPKKNVENV